MKNWSDVKIEDYALTFNKYDRPQYHSCNWCGNSAIKIITRTSVMSGNTYSDFACSLHTEDWKQGVKEEEQNAETI